MKRVYATGATICDFASMELAAGRQGAALAMIDDAHGEITNYANLDFAERSLMCMALPTADALADALHRVLLNPEYKTFGSISSREAIHLVDLGIHGRICVTWRPEAPGELPTWTMYLEVVMNDI